MGDSGAMLLGFTLAAISVAGPAEDGRVWRRSFLPLLVLAVPMLDTSFVVAKRLKYRQPIYVRRRARTCTTASCDIGFSQRRAVVYLWVWCATLAARGARDALRPAARSTAHWHAVDSRSTSRAGAARARRLGLHRLPARDREARRTRASGAAPPPTRLPEPRSSRTRRARRRPSAPTSTRGFTPGASSGRPKPAGGRAGCESCRAAVDAPGRQLGDVAAADQGPEARCELLDSRLEGLGVRKVMRVGPPGFLSGRSAGRIGHRVLADDREGPGLPTCAPRESERASSRPRPLDIGATVERPGRPPSVRRSRDHARRTVERRRASRGAELAGRSRRGGR